jgi:hypothetical protein
MVAVDRSWCEALEVERELARLAHDPSLPRRRRVAGAVRVIAAVALLVGLAAVVPAVTRFGVGAGLAAVWVLPMALLGVVLAAERVLAHFAK